MPHETRPTAPGVPCQARRRNRQALARCCGPYPPTRFHYDRRPESDLRVQPSTASREKGIPIETFSVEGEGGKRIATYRFGDPSEVRDDAFRGRSVLPKTLKRELVAASGARCAICACALDERYLQTDHRVPYEVAGAQAETDPAPSDYMLICGSCNRAKSWSCEHCSNPQESRDVAICRACYWASPEAYTHIALLDVRRLEIIWSGDEVTDFERLRVAAAAADEPMPEYVKLVIKRQLRRK